MTKIEDKLAALGCELPQAAPPAANYVPYIVHENQLFIAGQLPFLNGVPAYCGRIGETLSLVEGYEAAKACALNILAQVDAAVAGDWSRVERCIKLGGFVCSTEEFTDQPEVINGASELIVAVMGEAGRHARFAVGAPALPRGACVEIDAVFSLKPKK